MEKNITYTLYHINDLSANLSKVRNLESGLEHWFRKLDDNTRQKLQGIFDSASNHLADAKADISALTSIYLVCVAERLVKNEEEGRK